MFRYLGDHIYPDGCNVEISKHYQAVASLQHISAMVAKARAFDKLDDLPAGFIDRLQRVYDFTLKIMPPDRNAFQFGEGRVFPDHNPPFGESTQQLLEADFYVMERGVELFPERQDFRWIVTEGKEGAPPRQTSCYLPYAGFAVMRSSWDRNANFLGMKGSNTGLMHGDHGRNNIVLWAYGRPMLWNTPQSGWDAKTKTLVIVDGKNQQNSGEYGTAEPIDLAWHSTSEYDHAASMYDGFWGETPERPCKHIRRVLFVKPDVFLVVDEMIALDRQRHDYEARWVVKSEELAQVGTNFVTSDPGLPNLAIVPLQTSRLSVRKYSANDHLDFKELGATYKDVSVGVHIRSGTGHQRFVTLLLPLKKGQLNPIRAVEEGKSGKYVVNLRHGRKFTISLDPSHEGRIEFTEKGGAGRQIRVTTGSIARPFYLHYENFEVYDERESKITYENIIHHVAAPPGLAGAQGRFAGGLTLPPSGSITAQRSKAFSIPVGTRALVIKAMAGIAGARRGNVRYRMGFECNGEVFNGPWQDLDGMAADDFKHYQATVAIPTGCRQCAPRVDFANPADKDGRTVYIDRIRVLYPGEREEPSD
jgi:hypothetical protein